MAYTQTPYLNTHQFQSFPVTGYNAGLDSTDPDRGSRFINCEPRKVSSWGTDPVHILQKRPVLTTQTAITGTYFRGSFEANGVAQATYTAINNKVKKNGVDVLTLTTSANAPVYFSLMTVGNVDYIIVSDPDSGKIHVYNDSTAGVTDLAFAGVKGPVVCLDNYAFALVVDSSSSMQRIYNSAVGNPTTWTVGTDFIEAEMFPDPGDFLAVHHNSLVVFGRNSIEFFYDAANQLGSPLSRQASYASRIGNYGQYTPWVPCANINDVIYFLGKDGYSVGVYSIDNYKISKISNEHLDRLFNASALSWPWVVRSFNVVPNYGTQCLVICVADSTNSETKSTHFCFNPEEKCWSEWQFFLGQVTTQRFDILGVDRNYVYGYLYTNSADTTPTIKSFQLTSKDGTPTSLAETNPTAVWRPEILSFDNNLPKHIKWVDIYGSFANNTVTLAYSKEQTDGTDTVAANVLSQANRGPQYPLRWRNLGRGINHWLSFTFSGSQQIQCRGFGVAYNQGIF